MLRAESWTYVARTAYSLNVQRTAYAYSLNGWTDFDAQYLKRRRLVRGCAFFIIEKNRFMTLTFKSSKSAILFGLQNFDRHYLENGTSDGVHKSQIDMAFRMVTFRGRQSWSNPSNFEVE